MKKFARRSPCLGSSPRGVTEIEKNLAALAGALDAGGQVVDARGGKDAGLEI